MFLENMQNVLTSLVGDGTLYLVLLYRVVPNT